MKRILYVDPSAIKAAAHQAEKVLSRIWSGIESLEEAADYGEGICLEEKALVELREVCCGYEKLILYMNGAANVYGKAEKTVAELMQF